MSNHFHSVHPDGYIKFFPFLIEDTLKVSPKQNGMETTVVTAKNDIISLQTTKNKSDAGQWTAILASTVDYHSRIFPGCWCTIYMSDNELDGMGGAGEDSGLKMIGLVRSVRKIESTDLSTGVRTIQYQISGSDVSSVINMPIYINSALAGIDQGSGAFSVSALLYGKSKTLQSPNELANTLLNLIFGEGSNGGTFTGNPGSNPKMGFQFSVPSNLQKSLYGKSPDNIRFLKFLKTNFQKGLPGVAEIQPDIGGTITAWSLLKTYCNPLLNEIYCDIMPDQDGYLKPTLILRSIPFSPESGKTYSSTLAMNSGTTTAADAPHGLYISKEIEEHEIINLNYGKSDSDRFNFFLATPNMNAVASSGGEPSELIAMITKTGGLTNLSDSKSIERYGIKPFIASSIWIIQDPDALVHFNLVVREIWNKAHLFDNGMVSLIGSAPHISVGSNISFKDRGWLAHVESVSHSFSVEPETGKKRFRTEIAFVRLQDIKTGLPLFLSKLEPQTDPYDRGMTDSNNGYASWLYGSNGKES